MPRLVRRRPLTERIASYLNPLDFLLWLSEEVDTHDWDQFEKDWALPLGVLLNLTFLIARANSQTTGSQAIDDVFGDDESTPWLSWLVRAIFPHGSKSSSALTCSSIGLLFGTPPYDIFRPQRLLYLLP